MKKLVAIVAIIAMAFTGCTTGCNKENEVINETLENPEVVSNEVENQGAKQYRVTDETVNAYDFIIETMSKPQYYSDEQYVEGQNLQDTETINAYYEARGVDRTAWVLVDEETATFQRGYKYILTLNFSEYEAVQSCVYSSDYEDHYDFKDNEFYTVNLKTGHKTDMPVHSNEFLTIIRADGSEEKYPLDSSAKKLMGTNKDIETVRRCFNEYKELFEEAGCPLAGEPKGTLAKYKNKQIQKVEEVDDGLIHAIWEQEGFAWKWAHPREGVETIASWTDSPDIVWLDDYRDIQYAKAPESDYRDVFDLTDGDTGSVTHYESAPYSPVFLVFADVNDNNDRYANSGEFFALYYLTPLMKEIYGYNAVYFTDRTKVPNGEHGVIGISSKEEFERGVRTELDGIEYHEIATILNQGTEFVSCKYSLGDFRLSGGEAERDRFVGLMKDICDYYGKEYIFGDDYIYNFMTIFGGEIRELLGLM